MNAIIFINAVAVMALLICVALIIRKGFLLGWTPLSLWIIKRTCILIAGVIVLIITIMLIVNPMKEPLSSIVLQGGGCSMVIIIILHLQDILGAMEDDELREELNMPDTKKNK